MDHIKDVDAINFCERDEYDVIDYSISYSGLFDIDKKYPLKGQILRECRGLIFNKRGRLISRPFHKFFNIDELEETREENLDFSGAISMEKMDGSMVRPFRIQDFRSFESIRWGTRMGLTDQGMAAEIFAKKNPKYIWFADFCINRNITPIFEYIGPNNQIVLEYEKEDLILLNARHNNTGRYLSYDMIKYLAKTFDIPYVDHKDASSPNIQSIRDLKDREGVVYRLKDDTFVKLKSTDYVFKHKSNDRVRFDRHIVQAIYSKTLDDMRANVTEPNQKRIDSVEAEWKDMVERLTKKLNTLFDPLKDIGNRKYFASRVFSGDMKQFSAFLFRMYEGKSAGTISSEYIEKNLSTNAKYDRMKEFIYESTS